MITIEELKDKFIKRGYFIDDKLLWWTYTKINQYDSKIKNLGLFGPSGTGKTKYVSIYKDILSEILKENITLISFTCDYDKKETNIKNNSQDIIDKELIIKAISECNNGSKVILFIDGYDKPDQLTDIYLANLLQTGIIKDSEGNLIELKEKNNLQIIIAGNNSYNLFDSLQTKLDIVNLNHKDAFEILSYFDQESLECDDVIKYLIAYLYNKLELASYVELPSISEMTLLIKNIEFLIKSNAPASIINDIIFEAMLKHIPVKQFINNHKFNSLTNLPLWNKDQIREELIQNLNYENKFELLLLSKLKIEIVTLTSKTNQDNTFSLSEVFEKNATTLDISDYRRFSRNYDKDKNNNIVWAYDAVVTNNNRKWFKIADIHNANLSNVLSSYDDDSVNYEGLSEMYYWYPDLNSYISRLLLQCNENKSEGIYNISIYSSEPIIDCYMVNNLLKFLDTFPCRYCSVNFALFTNQRIEDEKFLSLVKEDPHFPNIYYYKNEFANERIYNKPIYNCFNTINQFKEVIYFFDNKKSNFIIPTNISSRFSDRKSNYKFHRNHLKLGKVKLEVFPSNYLGEQNHFLFDLINTKIGPLYNEYIKGKDYDSNNLFYLCGQINSEKKGLQKGIYIVNEGMDSELLLINPFSAFFDLYTYKTAIYEANMPFIKKLMR